MNSELDNYLNIIRNLKCNVRSGYKAPHKAVYLISIIDLISEGIITQNRFLIEENLVKCFENNWKKYVGRSPYFSCNIWNPIYYMEQNIVVHRPKIEFNKTVPSSIRKCNEVFEFHEIPMSLWTLLLEKKNQIIIKNLLITTFLTENSSSIFSMIESDVDSKELLDNSRKDENRTGQIQCKWIGANREIKVQGINLYRGNFYIGNSFVIHSNNSYHIQSFYNNRNLHSAVINPELPISKGIITKKKFSSYSELSESQRNIYLLWLGNIIPTKDMPDDILLFHLWGIQIRLFLDSDTTDSDREELIETLISIRTELSSKSNIKLHINKIIDTVISIFYVNKVSKFNLSDIHLNEYESILISLNSEIDPEKAFQIFISVYPQYFEKDIFPEIKQYFHKNFKSRTLKHKKITEFNVIRVPVKYVFKSNFIPECIDVEYPRCCSMVSSSQSYSISLFFEKVIKAFTENPTKNKEKSSQKSVVLSKNINTSNIALDSSDKKQGIMTDDIVNESTNNQATEKRVVTEFNKENSVIDIRETTHDQIINETDTSYELYQKDLLIQKGENTCTISDLRRRGTHKNKACIKPSRQLEDFSNNSMNNSINMRDCNYVDKHKLFYQILKTRGLCDLDNNTPLWKLKITEDEYTLLKYLLILHSDKLSDYGIEAALCYAEWWRRDYSGGIPSKEEVAEAIGLESSYAMDLFDSAYKELKTRKYSFLKNQNRTEYFRTLLNLGGLPVNYIKRNNNLGNFTRFLKGLVRELSAINHDFHNEDNSFVKQLNCISYLPNSFKNDNIYDVSFQIADAIISNDTDKLPYDDSDESLKELTNSLRKEYTQYKREKKYRPLSLHWKIHTTSDGRGLMYVNLDNIKDISSNSIPGLNPYTCYEFDLFISGVLVGKYSRNDVKYNEENHIEFATYTKITTGVSQDVLWDGSPVVEIKVRCDNDERLFLTIAGCYPPNFDYPQVFQMLDDNVFVKSETANSENNIVIFNSNWIAQDSSTININNICYNLIQFSESVNLKSKLDGEVCTITNKFSNYSVEFSGNYIPWIEKSNYKLLQTLPRIKVYDKEKNTVTNFKTKYKQRNDKSNQWYNLSKACSLSSGIVDFKVEFPDGRYEIESFYFIGDLNFQSEKETASSTEISCNFSGDFSVEIEKIEYADIVSLGPNNWRINKVPNSVVCPTLCSFRVYNKNTHVLKLSISIPFDGITITDIWGNIVHDRSIISLSNLANYYIVSHGSKYRSIEVSYYSEKNYDSTDIKHLRSKVQEGHVSLLDYSDLIHRIFNLYGANSFDRSSSVVFNISGKEIYIRKFVLESYMEEKFVLIQEIAADKDEVYNYDGSLYALPTEGNVDIIDYNPIRLCQIDTNKFELPENPTYKELMLFSGPDAKDRIIPKFFNNNVWDSDMPSILKSSSIKELWMSYLGNEDHIDGSHWKKLCKSYEICCKYNLPFTTFVGFKLIADDAVLLVKFITSMCLNGYTNILINEIDRFEQELVVAIHWIPSKYWQMEVNNLIDKYSNPSIFGLIVEQLVSLIKDLLNATVSTEISNDIVRYINGDSLTQEDRFTKSDINKYRSEIRGISDTNSDLPKANFYLKGDYYPFTQMPVYCIVMIESAMCAAENISLTNNHTSLFELKNKGVARVVNFYRKYFRELYCKIFLKALKLIDNNK